MKNRALAALAVAAVVVVVAAMLAACGSGDTTQETAGNGQLAHDDMATALATALDGLVEDGTITSTQQEAIVTALSTGMSPPQGTQGDSTGGTPPSAMPQAQGSPPAAPDNDTGSRSNRMYTESLDALVTDGTITSAQEEAVIAALEDAMPQGGGGPGAPSAAATAE